MTEKGAYEPRSLSLKESKKGRLNFTMKTIKELEQIYDQTFSKTRSRAALRARELFEIINDHDSTADAVMAAWNAGVAAGTLVKGGRHEKHN